MLKYFIILLLVMGSIWQVTRIQTVHKEIDCMTRVGCYNCQPKGDYSFLKNYYSAIDSLESVGPEFLEIDEAMKLELKTYMERKSELEFRPFISNVIRGDSTTSFELDFGCFQKITEGYIYNKGIKTLYNSDQCLPEKYDSLVAYMVDNVTGDRKRVRYP